MGMFDYINFTCACPNCGEPVKGFQSKDAGCEMETIPYWEVDNFYTNCDKCDTWIEYYRKAPKPFTPIEHYKMTFKKREKG